MKLLIIRHARAEELSGPFSGKRDADRRLTDAGRKDMRKAAKGLHEIAPAIDVLATSPLARARETAEIVAQVFGVRATIELTLLAPEGDHEALIAWLTEHSADATVAIVGHEPHLSALASLLIGAGDGPALVLKKGACGLIEFRDRPRIGNGTLLWLLQPGQLRRINA
jgi:phosphohistidine phosphatase